MSFSLLISWITFHLAAQQPASIAVYNIEQPRGTVLVAVYNRAEGFLEPNNAVFKQRYSVRTKGDMKIILPDLPDGNYAVSCFHDLNDNNTLDKNIFGIPTEPYGFSNNARPKFRAPTWEEAKCRIAGEISVRLEGW